MCTPCNSIITQYFIVIASMLLIYISLYNKVNLSPLLHNDYVIINFSDLLKGGCDGRTLQNQKGILPHWKSVGHATQGFLCVLFILCAPIHWTWFKHNTIYGTILSVTGTILGCTYQLYNFIKRTNTEYANGLYFAYSSYYVNLLDLFIGMLFGIIFTTIFLIMLYCYHKFIKHIIKNYDIKSGVVSVILIAVSVIILLISDKFLMDSVGVIECPYKLGYDNITYTCTTICELIIHCPRILVSIDELNMSKIC